MKYQSFNTPAGPLEYTIKHRSRVTKRLHMELDENGGLVVIAPRHWSSRHISATMCRNTARIERFINKARQQQLKPLYYIQGALHFYLGTAYPLVLHPVPGKKASVIFTGDELHVEVRQTMDGNIRAALQLWYRQQALRVFSDRLQLVSRRAAWASNKSVPLKLRRMKRTWGNCSSRGVIKLNTHLIKAPLPLIDSVIAHELCHLQQMNHGKAFYALLEGLNPDWRQDRAHLRSEGDVYLN